MLKQLLLLATLLALILLAVFCIRSKSQFVEADLVERAHSQLLENNIDWVEVSTDGRGLILTGDAPSADMSAHAEDALVDLWGVRSIDNQIRLPDFIPSITPDTYDLTATYDEHKLVLTGFVPDETTRTKIVHQAGSRLASLQIVDQLEIAAGAPHGWGDKVTQLVMGHLADYQSMTAHITADELQIVGSIKGAEVRDRILSELSQSMPSGYSLVFDVTTPEPEPLQAQLIKTAEALECEMKFTRLLSQQEITFAAAGARLKTESHELLGKLVATAKECPNTLIEISGFADSEGSMEANLKLSESKAQAVVEYLVSHGIDETRLSALGYGEKGPVAEEAASDGMAKHRHIEFNVLGE